jgi:hypothetical protein
LLDTRAALADSLVEYLKQLLTPMTAVNDSCRSLASPSVFEEVLDGGGALSGREEWAEETDYDKNARKLDFEGHLRALVFD